MACSGDYGSETHEVATKLLAHSHDSAGGHSFLMVVDRSAYFLFLVGLPVGVICPHGSCLSSEPVIMEMST